jgi:acyl carrier protein
MDVLSTQNAVLDIVKTELKRDDIGLDDDFFLLDGDSLAALAVINAIKEKLNIVVPVDTFFEAESIGTLCLAIAGPEITGS